MNSTKNIVIMDLDRCVLDPSERISHYLSGDLKTYEAMWETDKPIPQGLYVYSQFVNSPFWRCVFITSRRESQRKTTQIQLERLFPTPPHLPIYKDSPRWTLLMRPDDCSKEMKDDASIKPWLLEQAGFELSDVFIAFDDRQSVVDRWRELGVVCYQTAACVG